MTPELGDVTGKLMVTSRDAAMAKNFSCGNYVSECGLQFNTYAYTVGEGSTFSMYGAQGALCVNSQPLECGNSNPTSGVSNYSWSVGATSVIKLIYSSQSTLQSPALTRVSVGNRYADVTAYAGQCQASGQGSPTVVPCPTSITLGSLTPVPISIDPTLRTGYGAIASMNTNPTSQNWASAVITESISSKRTSCPASIGIGTMPIDEKNGKQFNVGLGASLSDDPYATYPAIHDAFYDEHSFYSTANALIYSNVHVTTCEAVISQTYYCGAAPIGTFTITKTFQLGTGNGASATLVSVTKQ